MDSTFVEFEVLQGLDYLKRQRIRSMKAGYNDVMVGGCNPRHPYTEL